MRVRTCKQLERGGGCRGRCVEVGWKVPRWRTNFRMPTCKVGIGAGWMKESVGVGGCGGGGGWWLCPLLGCPVLLQWQRNQQFQPSRDLLRLQPLMAWRHPSRTNPNPRTAQPATIATTAFTYPNQGCVPTHHVVQGCPHLRQRPLDDGEGQPCLQGGGVGVA